MQIADHLQSRAYARDLLSRQRQSAVSANAADAGARIVRLERQHIAAAWAIARAAEPRRPAGQLCRSLDTMNLGLTRTEYVPLPRSQGIPPGGVGATRVMAVTGQSRQPAVLIETPLAMRDGRPGKLVTRIAGDAVSSSRDLSAWRHQNLWLLASGGAAVLGLVSLFAMGNRLARPARRLAHAASALAVGDYRKRVSIRSADEFEVLGNAFNLLGESFLHHEEQLRSQAEMLAGMAEASRIASSTLDPKECSRSIARAACTHLGAAAAAVYIGDRAEGGVRRITYSGDRPSAAWERLAAHTTGSGEYLVMSEQHSDGVSWLAGVPLAAGTGAIGALVCRFTGIDRTELGLGGVCAEVLIAFGVHAAAAVSNAQAYSRSESYSEVLEDWVEHLSAVTTVTNAIAPALNLDEALDALANATLGVLQADECTILLPNADGNLVLRCAAGQLAVTRRRAAVHPLDPKESEAGRAFLEKRAICCPDVLRCSKRATREIALQTGARGLLSVPLLFQDRAIGVLSVCSVQPRDFTPAEVRHLTSIGLHAAVIIRNAGLYTREATIAEALQNGLISEAPAACGPLRFAGKYFPAADEARIGGDFYEVVELPDGKVGVIMADVSGKGLRAAIHLAETKYMLRAVIHTHPQDPGIVLRELNNIINAKPEMTFFVTVFYGLIDTNKQVLTYSSAGHTPAVLVSRGGSMHSSLMATGIPIGTGYPCAYSSRTVRFSPADLLLLYTDGAIESPVEGRPLGVEGLHKLVFEAATCSSSGIIDHLTARLVGVSGTSINDDMALLAVAFDSEVEVSNGSGRTDHFAARNA